MLVQPIRNLDAREGGEYHPPNTLSLIKSPVTRLTVDWVYSRAGLDVFEKRKICYPYRDLNPRPQPSCYTDYATPAPDSVRIFFKLTHVEYFS
jgi:hypothetical protein